MKITTNTPSQLVIDHRPWGWGIAIGVFVLVLVGAGMATLGQGQIMTGTLLLGFAAFAAVVFRLIVVRTQLFFHAPFGIVELRQKGMRGGTKEQILLENLKQATVQTLSSDKPTHRLALLLTDGTVKPVTTTYFSGTDAHRMADAINAWRARVDSLMNAD